MQKRFLITESVPEFFSDGLIKFGFELDINTQISQVEIEETISQYDGLFIRGRIKADTKLLARAAKLKYILRPGSGLDIIDIAKAAEQKIILINSPEGNRDAVAEHAIGMLLSLLNHIPQSFDDLKNNKWSRVESAGSELMSKTIGIIGFGNTGSAFAKKLSGFDVRILAYDKFISGFGNDLITEVGLNQMYAEADIVSFHIPLTSENTFLVDHKYLESFKKDIYLINTSRGKILKSTDLIEAITKGKIKGACLDVLENENLPTYSAEEKSLLNKLISTEKVIITPHIAGKTKESEEKIHLYLLHKLHEILSY